MNSRSPFMTVAGRILRAIVSVPLFCLSAFCVFGFLASFELGWPNIWHAIYMLAGAGSLALALRVLWHTRRPAGLAAVSTGVFTLVLLAAWSLVHVS